MLRRITNVAVLTVLVASNFDWFFEVIHWHWRKPF
jgi:hypothetical protein